MNYDWYRDRFRIFERYCEKNLADLDRDFYTYLAEQDPALYARIGVAWDEINTLWLSLAEHKVFDDALKTWFSLHKEAILRYMAWKTREREKALNAGRQEAMVLK